MGLRVLGVGALALLLVACNSGPLPRYKATLGTYAVKEGKKEKLGIALLSSFDPAFPVPQKKFEIRILGPNNFRASHVFAYPSVNKSDWFADPDLEVEDGLHAIEARIGGYQYLMSYTLDTESVLDYPEVTLKKAREDRVTVSWSEVEGSKVYYVTLNQKVPGQVKPLVVQEHYTTDLEFSFKNLALKVNSPYFVAVGALSLDPRVSHGTLSEPFNSSYGQTDQDIVMDAAGKLNIVDPQE
jgi:hypothetical protein